MYFSDFLNYIINSTVIYTLNYKSDTRLEQDGGEGELNL